MIDLTLKNEIENLVNDIFSKKADSDKKEVLMSALNDAKTKLEQAAAAVSNKDSEIEDLVSKLEEAECSLEEATNKIQANESAIEKLKADLASKDEEIAKLNKNIEASKAEVDEQKKAAEKANLELSTVKSEFEKVSTELANIKLEALVAKRMESLEKAGLARSDKEGIAVQKKKIASFSDEEFNNYKAELEAVKASIIASLNKNGDAGKAKASIINLEDDDDKVSIKEIGEALSDLFYGKEDKK